VAMAAVRLGLRHVVVTSVTRDDLPDGGAGHFADVTARVRRALPGAGVELLVPDFQGSAAALSAVLSARPDVLNHNVETVPHPLSPGASPGRLRPQPGTVAPGRLPARGAGQKRVHARIRGEHGPGQGGGRGPGRGGCAMITVGQYLRPSRRHPERSATSIRTNSRNWPPMAETGRGRDVLRALGAQFLPCRDPGAGAEGAAFTPKRGCEGT
jgi:lipoic acid synthetase